LEPFHDILLDKYHNEEFVYVELQLEQQQHQTV
jgi:hypothetical protein